MSLSSYRTFSLAIRFAHISGLTYRVFLPPCSVTHSSARPHLSVVILNIGPIRKAFGHVITSLFGTTP